jgi:O-antigen ligase
MRISWPLIDAPGPTAQLRTSRDSLPFASWIIAIAGSVCVGTVATVRPEIGIVLVAAVIWTLLAVTRPKWLMTGAVLLLAINLPSVAGGVVAQPQFYKAVLYSLILPTAIQRGVSGPKAAPLLAYPAIAIIAYGVGDPVEGLSLSDSASSLLTLCIGWLVFAINWEWEQDKYLLKVLAIVGLLSIVVGVGLELAGKYTVAGQGASLRLQGATIAPYLGAIGFSGVAACRVLHERVRWRYATALGWLNAAIVCATVTRGAIIAVVIIGLPTAYRYARRSVAVQGVSGMMRIALALIAILAVTVVLAPALAKRDAQTIYVQGVGNQTDPTSGRLGAWAYVYNIAKVDLVFGRGVGAGPIVGSSRSSPAGFTAQHNEYLRLLLEGGIVGGLLVLGAILTSMFRTVQKGPFIGRPTLWAFCVAFGVYSFTDNTLSAPALAISLLLCLSVGSSTIRSSSTTKNPLGVT